MWEIISTNRQILFPNQTRNYIERFQNHVFHVNLNSPHFRKVHPKSYFPYPINVLAVDLKLSRSLVLTIIFLAMHSVIGFWSKIHEVDYAFLCFCFKSNSEFLFIFLMCSLLTGKPTGKRPLGRPRRRCEDNIRMDLEEIGIKAGNWVDSAHDRNYWRALVNAA